MENKPRIYIVLGTRAQFIKVAPVMREMIEQGVPYTLIYTAQHRENIEEIMAIYHLPPVDRVMYDYGEANTKKSFLRWWVSVLGQVLFHPKKYLPEPGIVLTHGDTFTAWIAALLGKRAGCKVGHIESGCRSFNLFSPFPEEISRLITFQLTDIYFCADQWAVQNLKRYPGIKINMGANTILDAVRYALDFPDTTSFGFEKSPFAMVSIHRFENIFTSRFTEVILPILKEIAQKHHLVITLHPTTRERLKGIGVYEALKADPNFTLHERFGFIDWIHLCSKAEFVITDGGSNQEELSYLGVPTLLFRKETERQEGLGHNIVVSKFDRAVIDGFLANPDQYRKPPAEFSAWPSRTIIETIQTVLSRSLSI